MKEWKVGDEIEILRGCSSFYTVGAKGILVQPDEGQDWLVDFSSSPKGSYNPSCTSWYANAWMFDLSVELNQNHD